MFADKLLWTLLSGSFMTSSVAIFSLRDRRSLHSFHLLSRTCVHTAAVAVTSTANLRTKILDFRGFGSGGILISRGGILMPMGDFPRSLESTTSQFAGRPHALSCRASSASREGLRGLAPPPLSAPRMYVYACTYVCM